jgi:ApaG protein
MARSKVHQIEIQVKTAFSELQSNVEYNEYFFVYHIRIQNNGKSAVQLMSRKWYISDVDGENRIVEGEGVVGEQPVIEPSQFYTYYSGCQLNSGFGKMYGKYFFIDLESGEEFDSEIPEFNLVLPWLNN